MDTCPENIDIGQGLHQGGPSSSLYFLVIAELLAIKLRENMHIAGNMDRRYFKPPEPVRR